ncbi:glucose-6-phosphate exchanger SLC37A1 [Pelodiscus sinensis]|uniref:glucose-6-phosphate exchanger SLC37A1 n=1 Tax=Pelodiscus sinensis TaxID=13735 RepID=UPI0003C4C5F8|nr:glucose-6-phosphate exchanger SLC37A1 isoform X1 [Pelodiscus sinensis]XP_014436502.1 glucose-6-phosphate exchanger SLC37A1 isoform X1 [Pelodiscus sinensis]XP_025034647.1 glucose-6-phosphate exchanger SLC37A1 isoform X1 [Pelodiscus sinensis]XP_025034648.1 glucose-6-phosphate exchanger SLC37A1 isoform X2 [Pelodiscus sinensis]|eukprot:XP_006137929.1 glucose-6-phosphate exchanger SLC37A1 isoform X1 [Pelodiscus sinensis]
MAQLPPGVHFIVLFTRDQWCRAFTFVLTFLLYTSFHLSRKPISIVKGELHKHCAPPNEIELNSYKEYAIHSQLDKKLFNESQCGWEPFDKNNYKQLLGALDYSFLCAYAVGMYLSGIIGERLPIRYYLTAGMLASGLFTAMFGLGYFYNIHNLWFYMIAQIANGLVQTTGWPSVVTCIGNWFGKGRRGLIMGIWNSHTSVGNILGSLIAGYWVSTCWGLSFVVPGIIIACLGIVCFLFLVEHPKDISCACETSNNSKPYMNGTNKFRVQKPSLNFKETNRLQDPAMQCLLPDRENCTVPLNQNIAVNGESGTRMSAISFIGALRIPGVIEFSLCLLFAKLVSYTFLFWLPLYITNVEHLDAKRAGDLSTLFDVGGIFGGILAGIISDRLEKRASTCGMMLLLAAPTLYMFSAISKMGLEATIVMLLISGALVNGPYALITTAVSADLGTHKSLKGNARALSTVTAIIDGTGSVGAALGPLLAGLISPSGWNNVFYMLMVADACALLFLLRLIRKELQCKMDHTLFKEH